MTNWGRLSPQGRRSVALSAARGNLWEGAVRSSKTISSLFALADFVAHDAPLGVGLVSGRTKDTVRENVIEPMQAIFGRDLVHYVHGTGELILFGQRARVVGANDESSETRIRGATFAWAYFDELTVLPASFFRMALSRLSLAGARWYATTNPAGRRHWLKVDFIDRAGLHLDRDGIIKRSKSGLDLNVYSFKLADNPYLPDAYVQQLSLEYTGLWHRRFILGDWVNAEGAIYDQFDPDGDIVAKRYPTAGFGRFWIAVDYGTVNAFDALLLGEGQDGKLWVVSEYRWDGQARERQKAPSEYSSDMADWLRATASKLKIGRIDYDRLWVDPSAQGFIAQLRLDDWPRVRNANNAVADGIRDVSTLMANDGLRIHASCADLIDEIPGYVWDMKAAERGEDQPIKKDDHGCDALRYGVRGTRRVWRAQLAVGAPS